MHAHLAEIAERKGGISAADTAKTRIQQLSDEIAFFMRAQAQPRTQVVADARGRLQREREQFGASLRKAHQDAKSALAVRREQFVGTIDPMLARSVSEVRRSTEAWGGMHWATLRATVQRDGYYKSPSTGHLYDFNSDLAEPLLTQLPAAWERYFTDDLGRIAERFLIEVREGGKGFCSRVRLIVELLFQHSDARMEEQLAWFEEKLELLAADGRTRILTKVRERRTELAEQMPRAALSRMRPAYQAAKDESGSGMKGRILNRISSAALASARPIFETIQRDLVEGLGDLESILTGLLTQLSGAAEDQARIVAENANIDVGKSAEDPDIRRILDARPSQEDLSSEPRA